MHPRNFAEERGNKIARAAARLFLEKGYDSTSLADAAAELGMEETTLAHYFKDKAGLAASTVDYVITRTPEVNADFPPKSAATLEQFRGRISSLGENDASAINENPEIYNWYLNEASRASEAIVKKIDMVELLFAAYT